jgi:hypothetical protein
MVTRNSLTWLLGQNILHPFEVSPRNLYLLLSFIISNGTAKINQAPPTLQMSLQKVANRLP